MGKEMRKFKNNPNNSIAMSNPILGIFEAHYEALEIEAARNNVFLYLDRYLDSHDFTREHFEYLKLFDKRDIGNQSLIYAKKYDSKTVLPTDAIIITDKKVVVRHLESNGNIYTYSSFLWKDLSEIFARCNNYLFFDKNHHELLSVSANAFGNKGIWMSIFNQIIASNKISQRGVFLPQKVECQGANSNVNAPNRPKSGLSNQHNETKASQRDIKNAYADLLGILGETSEDIANLKGINSSFNVLKSKVLDVLNSKVNEANLELAKSKNETVWDNLVIAFFGETNAGKSTIIETFRILFDQNREKQDGLIVGDGRHDFTKTYEEYKLSLAEHPFTLIDVPGIEGNEEEFKDIIKTALHKAHIVFYIQGHNKKPDEATAKKIKKYLGDWVKVYSVYNVRGGVTNYDEEEERETLLTDGVLKTEGLVKSEFKRILGDVYAGHITIQALLAMSAKASFSPQREDLINGQMKLLRYFDNSPEKVLQFSQFQNLINLVEQKSVNFKAEIIEANKQKMISLAGNIAREIQTTMEKQKAYITQIENNLNLVERDVCNNSLDNASKNITYKVNNAIDRIYNELKSIVFACIDDGDSKEVIEAHQEHKLEELKENASNIVKQELRKANADANRKIKNLDGIRLKPINLYGEVDVDIDIDFSGALAEMDIDFDDVVGSIGTIGGNAAAGAIVGGVVGALIGAGIGVLISAVKSDGGKPKAKQSVSNAIGQAKAEAKKEFANCLRPVISQITNQKNELRNAVRKEKNNIRELLNSIDRLDDGINLHVKHLKNNGYGRI